MFKACIKYGHLNSEYICNEGKVITITGSVNCYKNTQETGRERGYQTAFVFNILDIF